MKNCLTGSRRYTSASHRNRRASYEFSNTSEEFADVEPTWVGFVYVAFVVDAFSRRIVGWRAARSMTTDLVLDALEHALFTRPREGVTDFTGLTSYSDAGSQYTSVALTQRLLDEGIDPSVGSVGDALDCDGRDHRRII